jgi:YD repeat-containing protein
MTVDALSQAVTPDATHLSNLRNNVNLNGAFVSTFTHEPLVGVTSMTEPSGRTTYYVYDNLSRLIESYYYEDNIVSTANKRTLNQYYYHNINQ